MRQQRSERAVYRKQWSISAPEGRDGGPTVLQFVNLARRDTRISRVLLREPLWGLDFHFENAGTYSLDGRIWEPRERGMVYLWAPLSCHWERVSPVDVPTLETYFVFRAEHAPELDALVSSRRGFARFRDGADKVRGVILELLETANAPGAYWRTQSALYRVLSCLLSAKAVGDGEYQLGAAPPAPARLSERVDAYIRGNFSMRLTLGGIAAAVGVSRSSLTHLYRRETGATPMDRLSELRLGVARSMILRGETLKAIAAHTGFYDESHLSNHFRRRYGLSPRRYARQAVHGSSGNEAPKGARDGSPGVPGGVTPRTAMVE